MSTSKASTSLDFSVFAGDPDEGAEAVESGRAIENFESFAEHWKAVDDLYGVIRLVRDGDVRGETLADPLVRLVTKLVRCIPYVIEGEPETVLLTESEHGLLLEPTAEEILVSFFQGSDAFDPEEYLFNQEPVPVMDFCKDVIAMAERITEMVKKMGAQESDDVRDLEEFLDVGKSSFRSFRLEKERGLRP